MPVHPLRRRATALLVAVPLALLAGACSADDEPEADQSPMGVNDDEGGTERDPTATVEEPGGERDARPAGEDPEQGGEVGEVQGDDDGGG